MVWPAMLTLLYPLPQVISIKLILIKKFIALKNFCENVVDLGKKREASLTLFCLVSSLLGLFTNSGVDFLGLGLILLVPDITGLCSVLALLVWFI